jgi:sugar/nucleoside kinase (ribokinase family)
VKAGRPDLIVVGDVMADVSVASEALAPGGDVHGEVRIRPGGGGANAAVWAAHSGAQVTLYGCVGDDLPGRILSLALRASGVSASLAIRADARTGAMLVVREGGERSMVADRGANARLSAEDLPDRLAARAVLLSGYLLYDPRSEPAAVAALARAEAEFVAVDVASWPLLEAYGRDRFHAGAQGANFVLANAREAEVLTGRPPVEAARALAARYRWACVKLGAEGAVLATADRLFTAPAPDVDEVDATGAGDAFDGALLAELSRGADPEAALRGACEAGAKAASSTETWPERAKRRRAPRRAT